MVSLEDLNQEAHHHGPTVDEPQFISLRQAGAILDTLSVETRRAIMREVCADPANPAAIAGRLGLSVQNTSYHLEKLEESGLIEVVGTKYSNRGHEMEVFAPCRSAIVIEIGESESSAREFLQGGGSDTTEQIATDGGRQQASTQSIPRNKPTPK